jgi:Tfp pilus assembly protein PilO
MRDLAQIKNRFFILIGVLAAINLVLLAYLLWPGTSNASRRAREETLQQQYRTLTREVAPLKDMDQKLVHTRGDIDQLYKERIPNRWSAISSELIKVMKDSGVTPAQSIHYTTADKQDKSELPDVQRVNIDTSITGQYTNVARFINQMEQDKLLFIIKQISLSGQEGGTVTLQIKVETFLKAT